MVESKAFHSETHPPLVLVTPVSPTASVATRNEGLYHSTTPASEWSCPKCTLLNPTSKFHCDACDHRQPDHSAAPPAAVVVEHSVDSEEDYTQESEAEAYSHIPGNKNHQIKDVPSKYCDTQHVSAIGWDWEENGHGGPSHGEGQDFVEDPFERKIRRRMRRKRRMVVGGITGLIVGSILLCGPLGAVAGAVGGAWGARAISKRRERAKDERIALERLASSSAPKQLPEPKQLD